MFKVDNKNTSYAHEKILRTQNCRRKFIKIYILKNAKKTCKPNNRDLNRDWITLRILTIYFHVKHLYSRGNL